MTIKNPEYLEMSGNFMKKGRDIHEWLNQAEKLHKMAEAGFKQTKEDRQLSSTEWSDSIYKYLVGITLENLLKGIMIAGDPGLIKQHSMDTKIKKHDIWTRYADDELQTIKTDLSQDEQDFMKIAEYYVMWVGRYPIADNESDFIQNRKTIERLNLSPDNFDARFQAIYEKIHQKLLEKWITSTKNQWKADGVL
jgi:hypothetical protein